MDFAEYQEKADSTAVYPNRGNNFVYPVLGLAGETGEICEKLKKVIRDNDGVIPEDKRELLQKELGDVLWYINALATELGFSLNEIAEQNIDKLFDRKDRGVLKGSGDER